MFPRIQNTLRGNQAPCCWPVHPLKPLLCWWPYVEDKLLFCVEMLPLTGSQKSLLRYYA
ncbi:hypothetical protein PVAP13_3NG078804 [Panicum virgatum]|uniref:Uncharacterized protein n=1 Tax=Panicum virgatum TaxID=38727 RepID=A0A8T0UI83_PANVG|nr:hypothetical protein PVAP13_3NG078804 [Panicum virgatum]